MPLTDVEAFSYSWEVPHGLNRNLCDSNLACFVDADLSIRHQTTLSHTFLELGQLHVCSCNGNGRPDFNIVLVHGFLVQPGCKMAIGVHCHNLLPVAPLGEGPNLCSGLSVGEIGLVGDVQVLAGYGKSVVDGVGASVSTNS